MKLSRKLILTLALVLSVAMATTGTLAYLTDRESNANIFTVGNVDITLNEEYVEPSELIPDVEIRKAASIENSGDNSAYVWGTIAVPSALKDVLHIKTNSDGSWTWEDVSPFTTEIEGIEYYVYTGLYNNELTPGETTTEMMMSVTMDRFVDIAPDGSMNKVEGGVVTDLFWNINDESKPVIYVSAYALQSEGVEGGVKAAYELYTEQWGDPANGENGGMGSPENNEFVVQNSDELREALNTIKNDSAYWNKEVAIKLASTTYDGDFVINQYPEWNGNTGAGGTANNMPSLKGDENVTHIIFEGTGNATFTGNVTVNGFGNANSGFVNANASTTFNNIKFDADDSVEENGEDKIVVYALAAANNVAFNDCEFTNATHVTVGRSSVNRVGSVSFDKCTFNNGGSISGYVSDLDVTRTKVTAADNGFIDVKTSGTTTVHDCEVQTSNYMFRTQGTGIAIEVTDSIINAKELVKFRGDGTNTSANFSNCTINDDYTYTMASGAVLTVNGVTLN